MTFLFPSFCYFVQWCSPDRNYTLRTLPLTRAETTIPAVHAHAPVRAKHTARARQEKGAKKYGSKSNFAPTQGSIGWNRYRTDLGLWNPVSNWFFLRHNGHELSLAHSDSSLPIRSRAQCLHGEVRPVRLAFRIQRDSRSHGGGYTIQSARFLPSVAPSDAAWLRLLVATVPSPRRFNLRRVAEVHLTGAARCLPWMCQGVSETLMALICCDCFHTMRH